MDRRWRELVQWQGKDDRRRTISKNFTFGGQYFYVSRVKDTYKARVPSRVYKNLLYNPHFVYSIPNIQSYKLLNIETGDLDIPNYEQLAIKFVESNIEIQHKKAIEMEKIRKDKIARTLYGAPRKFYMSNHETAKKGFNHRIQGTVASYINESCVLLQSRFPSSYLIHNQHDSLKWAFSYEDITEEQALTLSQKLCQKQLDYAGNSVNITATFKIVRRV